MGTDFQRLKTDDQNADINPGAAEACDGVDNNCNDQIDELPATDPKTWYADTDADGFGDALISEIACNAPEGFVANDDDCDDQAAHINPDGVEVCDDDDADEDCNGQADDGDAGVDSASLLTGYADVDQDGYGDASFESTSCTLPEGYVDNAEDCDDSNALVNPEGVEVCDGLDNDCNASTTEDGMARFVDDDSNVTDYPSFGGSAGAPDTDAPQAAGELTVCDGTYYIDWTLSEDLTVRSQSGDPAAAVFDGGGTNNIFLLGSSPDYGGGYFVNLSIDGLGFANSYKPDFGGVITCADSSVGEVMSWVNINNSVFSDNFSDWSGAAVGSEFCDLTISNTEFTGNHSDGWGVVWSSGWTEITDSVFDGNSGAVNGGFVATYSVSDVLLDGVDFFGNELTEDYGAGTLLVYYPGGSVTLDGVNVYENLNQTQSAFGTGISIWGASDVEIIGSTASPGSVTGNADPGPGLYVSGGSVLSVEDVNFGANGGADDNAGADIAFGSYEYMAPESASFLCSNYYCGENTDGDGDASDDSAECFVGDQSVTSLYYMASDYLVGQVVLSDSYATIESFRYWVSSSSTCSVDWYILSSPDYNSSSVWTVEWSSLNHSSSTTVGDWDTSGRIGYAFDSGTYYALVYAVDCPSSVHKYGFASTGSQSPDPGFGTMSGYVYKSASIADMNVGDTLDDLSLYANGGSSVFTSKMWINDLESASSGLCP